MKSNTNHDDQEARARFALRETFVSEPDLDDCRPREKWRLRFPEAAADRQARDRDRISNARRPMADAPRRELAPVRLRLHPKGARRAQRVLAEQPEGRERVRRGAHSSNANRAVHRLRLAPVLQQGDRIRHAVQTVWNRLRRLSLGRRKCAARIRQNQGRPGDLSAHGAPHRPVVALRLAGDHDRAGGHARRLRRAEARGTVVDRDGDSPFRRRIRARERRRSGASANQSVDRRRSRRTTRRPTGASRSTPTDATTSCSSSTTRRARDSPTRRFSRRCSSLPTTCRAVATGRFR